MAAILYHRPVEITTFYAGSNNIMCFPAPFYALSKKLNAQNGPFKPFSYNETRIPKLIPYVVVIVLPKMT